MSSGNEGVRGLAPGGTCPHCGNDATVRGAVYAVHWVPTRAYGMATPDGLAVIPDDEPRVPMWDWEGESGPERRAFACSECGGELDLHESPEG